MPNEFKVKNGLIIDQGGATITGSVIATGGFTGSLQGTSSWATNALTASFINTASTNAFVQGGNSFGTTALLGTNDNQSLAFRTNGSTKMLISGSGVGIGNIPQSGFSLDANSSIVTRASFYVNSDIYFFGPSNSSIRISGLRFTDLTTSTTQVNISTTGNLGIGIGTTTASSRLQVRGSGTTSATTALRVENTNTSASLVVLDDGYVGIGTGSAAYNLDVNGSTMLRGITYGVGSGGAAVQLLSTVSTNIGVVGGNASNPLRLLGQYLQFYVGNTQMGLFQPTTGNFILQNGGIFADAGYRLDVSGSARITNNLNVTGSLIVSGSSIITGSLQVGIPGTSAATIDTAVGTLGKGSGISVDWVNRTLYDSTAGVSTDWENRILYDQAGADSVEWNGRVLYDSGINASIDWENRLLSTPGGYNALVYSNDITANSELYIKQVIGTGIQEDAVSSTTYSGQIIIGTLDPGVSTHQLVYLDTDGDWKPTKAGIAYGANKMLGICVDSGKSQILIEGDAPVSDDNTQGAYVIGADHGLPVYVSATTGEMTVTAPSGTGELVRIVGHIYYQSTTDTNWWTMKFRPSNDWYEI
jgi:hypothetical protein